MQKESFRHRLHERLGRFRRISRNRISRNSSEDSSTQLPRTTQANPNLAANAESYSLNATSSVNSQAQSHLRGFSEESKPRKDDAAQAQIDRNIAPPSDLEQTVVHQSNLGDHASNTADHSDLWSAAYREAVQSLGDDINVAILQSENVGQLFRDLEEIDKKATQESVFLRGARYLHSIKVPLETFRLALDLATPLTLIEPVATTAVGAVRTVTAIAISIATVDVEFAKQIGEMLEQISYIDDCDTLGQKSNKKDIHKALVSVYRKILEFYKATYEILTRKGVKLLMKMILENDRLPSIVQDFLKHADTLRSLVQKATWEIAEDIKTMLYDVEITRWLGGGKISRQSEYHAYLQDIRGDQACEFLLNDLNFINWYSASDSQELVILGDMGSGKTVLMSYLLDELRRRNERLLPQPKICYCYCRDDETGRAVYIFSVLILSLLEQFSGMKKTFYEWYKHNQASGNLEPAKNVKKLKEFLHEALKTLDRPLFVIIDGLDECDRASRNSLLDSLKTLSHETSRLKVALSSRPQEEVLEQLSDMARIDLYPDAQRDAIIVRQTVDRQLSHLTEDVRALIIERLSIMTQGSAIWTKMTVELIEVRGIRAFNSMRLFLEEIPLPSQLSKLFVALLTRFTSNDPENQELAEKALKLLAVAGRPLSILEVAWGATLSVAGQKITTVAALAKLVDHQRVMSFIQPFVARVDFDDLKKRQVRLTHQSVKEFIVESALNQPRPQDSTILKGTDKMLVGRCPESLDAWILDVCFRYLLLDDIGNRELFSEEQVAIEELPQEADLFEDDKEPVEYDHYCTWEVWEESMIRYDPTERGFGDFFVYAACHWLEYFGAVTAEALLDLRSVESLCKASSTRLYNWIEQYRRPDCTIKGRFMFECPLYDPLSITSLYGSEAALRNMLEKADFDSDKYLPRSAAAAADQILLWGDWSRLKILFAETRLNHQLHNFEFFQLVIRIWSGYAKYSQEWDSVFDLVDLVSDALVQEQWGNELLCAAARAGCLPIIQRLMRKAQHQHELRSELLREYRCGPHVSSLSKSVHQSVGEAVAGNHVDVVEYLLDEKGIEAHLQYVNSRGENILHLASTVCNPAIFRLIIPRFQKGTNQADDKGDTALMRVIKSSSDPQDRYESAKLLLSHGRATEDSLLSKELETPLRAAVRLGDLEMCFVLISIGQVSPLSALTRDQDEQMILKDEVAGSPEDADAILQLLCRHANLTSMQSASRLH